MIELVVVAVVDVDVVDLVVVVVVKVGMWIGVGDSVKEGFANSISTQSSIQYGPYRGPLWNPSGLNQCAGR